MDIHFGCTQCGNCCKGLKLPLTVAEAVDWLGSGHQVQIICEAAPTPAEGAEVDASAAHFGRRSFAAISGSSPAQVAVILAASFAGNCPNLRADMRCGIYDRRPLVCRIYPAEINPCIELKPASKSCPAEAWAAANPVLQCSGRILSAVLRGDIQKSRDTTASDAGVKQRVCTALQVRDTAPAGDGFVVHSPSIAELSSALAGAIAAAPAPQATPGWRYVSDRPETVQHLTKSGAAAIHVRDIGATLFQYVGFKQTA
ncbi:MAG: YkgJ family cysteine cluster protein [Steroidobacterales bacterium]